MDQQREEDSGLRRRKDPSREEGEMVVLTSLPLQPAPASLTWDRALPVQGPPKHLPSRRAPHTWLEAIH